MSSPCPFKEQEVKDMPALREEDYKYNRVHFVRAKENPDSFRRQQTIRYLLRRQQKIPADNPVSYR
jgi:hypothetical protein